MNNGAFLPLMIFAVFGGLAGAFFLGLFYVRNARRYGSSASDFLFGFPRLSRTVRDRLIVTVCVVIVALIAIGFIVNGTAH